MKLRSMKTSALVRELGQRRKALEGERNTLLNRVQWVEEQLKELEALPVLMSTKSAPVRKPRYATPRGKAYKLSAGILQASKKPMTAAQLDAAVRKTLPELSDGYASKALSRMYESGKLTRKGSHGRYMYTWKSPSK